MGVHEITTRRPVVPVTPAAPVAASKCSACGHASHGFGLICGDSQTCECRVPTPKITAGVAA